MTPQRLGFFTRLVRTDAEEDAATVYRQALEQIALAERLGYDTAWVAQHHLDPAEGGLPSPFVFLAHAAAGTTRIRFGTAIVTLALEDPIRVAEDAAVLDTLSGGRLELGFGAGGSRHAFELFELGGADRQRVYADKLAKVTAALSGSALVGERGLNPPAPGLRDRLWQATFSAGGAQRAGEAGDGLLLSKAQPRDASAPEAALWEIQQPLVDAYLAALPAGVAPRIGASRGVFVADDHDEAIELAERGAVRFLNQLGRNGGPEVANTVAEVLRDIYYGTPDEVAAQLAADTALRSATDFIVQAHPVDPGHAATLRSIELIATKVAPQLGWRADERINP
ncbi:putative FMN-dependent luciferase-like monooxygenase [Nocardia yunnanensis]|uniref:Putative FMN-dependent luciferase-like monooxygenase n=1 Tax=Nocardia yunnanensis TaxID=2382165 RepID=A0A386Z728_9NOCA|nr:putative FMN-dependent luciferase-like monooxygenase [Nocardia yunnanensis]AYF73451.1 putative FMN-dependent luciferase-like monooxygenase [Nocardia yunnanensis]